MSAIGDGCESGTGWAIGPPRARSRPWAVAVSLLLHALVGLALLIGPPVRLPEPAGVPGIEVEILTLPAAAPVAPASSPPTAARPSDPVAPAVAPPPAATPVERRPPDLRTPSPAPTAPSAPETPGVVRPTRMLSARGLDDPRSRAARQALGMMSGDDRAIQLCGLEAMAQVAAWRPSFAPDEVVAQATAEVTVAGDDVVADGGAFHSGRQWYGIRFRCGLTADHRKVAAFEFRVGDAIPDRYRQRYNLPAEGGPLD